MRLFIGGMHTHTTAEDVRLWIEANGYSCFETPHVVMDHDTKRSRGFGFVTLHDPETQLDETEVLERLHKSDLMGRTLTVSKAQARPAFDRKRK